MPIYEYECTECGERFEIKQSFSDPPIKTCDQFSCSKAQPVTKIISAPAIMFKGTGWYVTDYSDKLKEPGTKSENKGKPTEVKGEGSTGDKGAGTASSGQDSNSSATSSSETSSGSTSSSSTSSSSSGQSPSSASS